MNEEKKKKKSFSIKYLFVFQLFNDFIFSQIN